MLQLLAPLHTIRFLWSQFYVELSRRGPQNSSKNLSVVQQELRRWCAAGIITDSEQITEFDLVRFWQVSHPSLSKSFLQNTPLNPEISEILQSKKHEYPILSIRSLSTSSPSRLLPFRANASFHQVKKLIQTAVQTQAVV